MLKSNFLRIRTARLVLIAATLELAKLEMEAADDLARALECAMSKSWPPPLNDEHSQRWPIEMLRRDPAAVGWGLWYLVRDQGSPSPELVGNAGFKGRPVKGICEIGYSLLPTHQGRGYATEAARALVAWAFAHPEVNCVAAETLLELIGSIRVMEKCGMHFVAEGKPEDGQPTVRYQVTR